MDALDLDTSLDESVTVVEWGSGLVESLAEDRLELVLERPRGAVAEHEDAAAGVRHVTITAIGPRWADVDVAAHVG